MSGILVDSDILIEVLCDRKPEMAEDWRDTVSTEESIFYSPVAQAEIRHGMRERERQIVERFFSSMTCLPIDDEIGQLAGDYLRAFHRSHALEMGDALIAATASVHGLALWTNNHKHFPMKSIHFFRGRRRQ